METVNIFPQSVWITYKFSAQKKMLIFPLFAHATPKHIFFITLLYLLCFVGHAKLRPSSLLEVDTSGGTLTIKKTQNADAGDYTCLAVNAAGTASGRISLSVGGASGTKFSSFSKKQC